MLKTYLSNRFFISIATSCFELVYGVLKSDRRLYQLLNLKFLQPLLINIGSLRAYRLYLKAKKQCPAYANFVSACARSKKMWRLEKLPVMTKNNYIKKYSLEERCYEGKIAINGTIVDESSGSSGIPNNWVRNLEEREDLKRVIQLTYQLIHADRYKSDRSILLNCFALGCWATGMNVSMALADVAILKSIGCDRQKLENTLHTFGKDYRYLIFGYPPFIKSFIDNTQLDLSQYKLNAIVGGEGISESLRNYFLKYFDSVISSYGASDLEINIGMETELTINLRRLCHHNSQLSRYLFGRDLPPAIFQYNPLDYTIETLPNRELVFTVNRVNSAAPKIRYNLLDVGGTIAYDDLSKKLKSVGIAIEKQAKQHSYFPILFIYGRSDLTISFYGANIYPSDLEAIINTHPILVKQINSFQISCYEDEQMNRKLIIYLETILGRQGNFLSLEKLRDIFFEKLSDLNQDFREVTKIFDRNCLEVIMYDFGTGVFEKGDRRVKNQYITNTIKEMTQI
jgi:phenylacetate-CoA ligase